MPSGKTQLSAIPREGSRARPLFAVAAVLLGSFVANFDSRLTVVGLPDLRGAFSLSFDEGAWLSTASIGSQIFIAPAVAWLATVFGLRRVLGLPSLIFAAISVIIPFLHDYSLLMTLSIVHGLLIGAFVPATLLIIFRTLPTRWWLPGIALYAIRVGFAVDTSSSLVGFYVEHWGWAWLYWQGAVFAPLMALMVRLGTPQEPINRLLLKNADWGGMLLLGTGLSMLYAGLDQGNRLDWLESGPVVALLTGAAILLLVFVINEFSVAEPWAHVDILFNRNVGLALVSLLLYALVASSNASLVPNFLGTVTLLRPEQSGALLWAYGALPMLIWVPISVAVLRLIDARLAALLGFSAFATANLLGMELTHDWAADNFIAIVILQSFGQAFTVLPIIIIAASNVDRRRATAFIAYIQMVRLGGAEIGVALMGTWLRVREQVHSNFIGQHVENGRADVTLFLDRLGDILASRGASFAPQRALDMLAALVQRESNVLAYIDGFELCFSLAITALIVISLLTRAPPGPFTPDPLMLAQGWRRLSAWRSRRCIALS
jgi:DHA2 family multidrug resistance protein